MVELASRGMMDAVRMGLCVALVADGETTGHVWCDETGEDMPLVEADLAATFTPCGRRVAMRPLTLAGGLFLSTQINPAAA